ncbi:Hsp70 family protein [Streptomyces albiflavescens]|uniref:Hsp70 family protein n=1 Tax=Streptomyces albiflavescens TaxID=1623582 RepID=UPI001E4EDA85|nr:Hsp70 family protein [Streptomyces albiflavescens]
MAVAVGCSHYEDEDIADLRFAHLDAMRMRDMFINSMDISDEAVFTFADGLPGAGPTKHNVIRTLSKLAKHAAAPIDRLFFFFSGHGFHSTSDGDDYLITSESLTDALEDTSLNFVFLVRMLRATGAQHVVLLLDACRTPVAGGKSLFAAAEKVDVERLCPPGMVSFCSCGPGTSSYESEQLKSGIFTEALYNAFGDEGRCVTVEHLDGYLTAHVPRLARQYEKPVQEPYSRVEPAALVGLEIVSLRKRNEWRASAGVGEELRQRSVIRINSAKISERAPFAIDFGTTNSVIAVADDDSRVHFVPAGDGRRLVPSVITFVPDLDYLVGSRAVDLERFSAGRTVRAIKRHLGTEYAVPVDGKELSAELLSSLVIRSLRSNAEDALGKLPREAMIAYPANFSIRQANSLLHAFELAGLRARRMVGEPNIACVLLHLDRPDWEGNVLVVDLGGGTLDVAVAEVGDQVHEIKSVYGDNHLGGLDFDVVLAGVFRERLRAWNNAVTFDAGLEAQILHEAERAKQLLTEQESAQVVIRDVEVGAQVLSHHFTVERAEFREVCAELTERFAEVVRAAIDDAYLDDPIDVVLLSGQGGKIFTVRECLEEILDDVEFVATYQDLAVAHGLALYSSLLSGASAAREGAVPLLLDLSHRGIGIRCSYAGTADDSGLRYKKGPSENVFPEFPEVLDERYRKAPDENAFPVVLIERLTTIPTMRSEYFTFVGSPGADVVLPVVEKSKTSHEDVEIGVISFPVEQAEVDIELTVEIDANSAMLLQVADRTNHTYRRYQLNQYYRDPNWVYHNSIDLLLDGWTLYDIERIDPAFRTSRADGDKVPMTLDSLDIRAEIAQLRKNLDLDIAARQASGVYAAGINDAQSTVLRRVARLLFALGRKAEGADALAESVHALLTWPGPNVPWSDVAERIELARHELTGDPALATVRNALAAVLTRHETIPETASEGVPKAFRALRAIGAKTEARHLARLYEGDVEGA